MKMLGAKLSCTYRKTIGIFCRDNSIGFFNKKYDESRNLWRRKGLVKQKEEYEKYGKKNTYYFKYTTAGRTQYASIGGKASYASGNCKEFLFWASPDGRKIRASLGGKSHFGKKWVNKDGIVKFVHESKLNEYISSGWSIGSLRKWVNKCGEIKQINQSELESYLGDGWSVGKSRKS